MKIEEIEKLCDEASPGPWKFDVWLVNGEAGRIASIDSEVPYGEDVDANGLFIAHARTLLPKLLAVAKAAKEFYTPPSGLISPEQIVEHYKARQTRLGEALADLERE